MKKNWELIIPAVVLFAIMIWAGHRWTEQDKNLALLQHCAAVANDGKVGTQSVCVNDETEVGSVKCTKFSTGIKCEMAGLDYGFDL